MCVCVRMCVKIIYYHGKIINNKEYIIVIMD